MRESKVEKHLVARVTALGGETRKVQWVGRSHAPDRLVLFDVQTFDKPILRIGFGSCFVETKAPGEEARDGQLREHERLRKAGFVVLVLDTIEKIDEVFGV